MSLEKPYYLTYRPNERDPFNNNYYMHRPKYVKDAVQYVRIAQLLYKDFEELFDYVEPSDKNKDCYSFRIYELLLRACTEVESNMKGILVANGYKKGKEKYFCKSDYLKLEKTHHLPEYEVLIPNWSGELRKRIPFANWKGKTEGDSDTTKMGWYDAYNTVKHNRQNEFNKASLENAIDAYCGLLVLLTSQFYDAYFAEDRKPDVLGDGPTILNDHEKEAGFISTIGAPFEIKLPNWPEEEKYNFDWGEIKGTPEPYAKLKF